MIAPADLGVPAFNLGNAHFRTQDFNNGLGLMINGVQHVYVTATHYHHDAAAKKYYIALRFVFYGVFGLGRRRPRGVWGIDGLKDHSRCGNRDNRVVATAASAWLRATGDTGESL